MKSKSVLAMLISGTLFGFAGCDSDTHGTEASQVAQASQALQLKSGKPVDTTPDDVARDKEKAKQARRLRANPQITPPARKLTPAEKQAFLERLERAKAAKANNH